MRRVSRVASDVLGAVSYVMGLSDDGPPPSSDEELEPLPPRRKRKSSALPPAPPPPKVPKNRAGAYATQPRRNPRSPVHPRSIESERGAAYSPPLMKEPLFPNPYADPADQAPGPSRAQPRAPRTKATPAGETTPLKYLDPKGNIHTVQGARPTLTGYVYSSGAPGATTGRIPASQDPKRHDDLTYNASTQLLVIVDYTEKIVAAIPKLPMPEDEKKRVAWTTAQHILSLYPLEEDPQGVQSPDTAEPEYRPETPLPETPQPETPQDLTLETPKKPEAALLTPPQTVTPSKTKGTTQTPSKGTKIRDPVFIQPKGFKSRTEAEIAADNQAEDDAKFKAALADYKKDKAEKKKREAERKLKEEATKKNQTERAIVKLPTKPETRPGDHGGVEKVGPEGSRPLSELLKKPVAGKLNWTQTPNQVARYVLNDLAKGDKFIAQTIIEQGVLEDNGQPGETKIQGRANLPYPHYAFRDVEIRDGLWQVLDKVELFSVKHFGGSATSVEKRLETVFTRMDKSTINIIGSVASGGPRGYTGWLEFLYSEEKRHALVCAIICNVLTQQVYQHRFFGAHYTHADELDNLDEQNLNEDGFVRTRLSAEYIQKQLRIDHLSGLDSLANINRIQLPSEFLNHVIWIVRAILVHLYEIWRLLNVDPPPNDAWDALIQGLVPIVTKAGILSLIMHADPHTVYYFTPAFKEAHFDQKDLDAQNRRDMEQRHPKVGEVPSDVKDKDRDIYRTYHAYNQVVIMDGLTAYRQGGWEKGGKEPSTPVAPLYEDDDGAMKGQRSRILSRGYVFCRWGNERKFTRDGEPADDKSLHHDWKSPGFVELRNYWKELRAVDEKYQELCEVTRKAKGSPESAMKWMETTLAEWRAEWREKAREEATEKASAARKKAFEGVEKAKGKGKAKRTVGPV